MVGEAEQLSGLKGSQMRVFDRTPLNKEKLSIPSGQVFLIPDRCKGCELCIHFCPQGVLEVSKDRNTKGYHYPTIVIGKEHECVNCEFCTLICSEFAIFTLPSQGEASAG